MIRALWRSKWGLLRLAIASFVLWVVVSDTGARLARLELASLPDFDFAAQVRALRAEGRYGEALVVAESGLETLEGPARIALEQERDATKEEQASFLRRAKEVGKGAVTGTGDSLEAILGAIAADFFIVGDVRDLVIQGTKQALDGDSDEVILALSVAGVVTTLAPEIDWVPSILKGAKRTGAISKNLGRSVVDAVRAGDFKRIEPLMKDVKVISDAASPGGAVRLLRYADDEKDVAKLASFLRTNRRGAFALHVTGDTGAKLIKQGGEAGELLVVKAAGKGRAGAAFLSKPAARAILRPHMLIGIGKGLYKGNAEKLITRLVDAIDPRAWWIIPALAAWVWLEAAIILRRLGGSAASSGPKRQPLPA